MAIFDLNDVGLMDKSFHPYSITKGKEKRPGVNVITGAIKPKLKEHDLITLDDNQLASKERGKFISLIFIKFRCN